MGMIRQTINILTNFLSNKNNLTLLQCLLYGVLGYLLKGNYDWTQFCVVFVILLGIQFITHIKAVAQGMMMLEMMQEDGNKLMKFIKQMEEDHDDERPN